MHHWRTQTCVYTSWIHHWWLSLKSCIIRIWNDSHGKQVFSPPDRWGLLDFNVWGSSFFSSFSSSSVSSCDDVWSVWCAGPQPRSCEVSVPHRTSTAILWVQCSAPDLNREPVSSVFRTGPQPRSCEFSVPHRTSTAILWVQCSAPDLSRYVRRYVRKNVRKINYFTSSDPHHDISKQPR